MKALIKVGHSVKFPIKDFEMIEENGGLEIEVEYEDEDDLEKQIQKWQKFVHQKVTKSAFEGANLFIEKKKEITG